MVELIIENKKYVSTRLAAVLLKCTNDYAGKLAREGKITAIRHNNFWFIEEASIQDYLRESALQKSIQRKELSKQREIEYRNRNASLKIPEKNLVQDTTPIPSLFSVKQTLMVVACFVVLVATKFLASDAAFAHVDALDFAQHIGRNVAANTEQIVSDAGDAVIGFGTATLKPVQMIARDVRYMGENYVAGIYTAGRSLYTAGEKINYVIAKIDQGISHNTASAITSLDFAEKRIALTYQNTLAGISQAFRNVYDTTVNSVYAVGQSVIDAGKIYSKGIHVVADTITGIVGDEYYADQLAVQTPTITRAPQDNGGAIESEPKRQDQDEDGGRDVVVVNRNPVIVQGISELYLERRLAIFKDSLDLQSNVTVVNKTIEGSRISSDRIYDDISDSSNEAAEDAVTGGNLSFSGIDGTFTGGVSVGGDLSVTGTTTLSGPLVVGGSSGIAGYVLQSTGTGAVWVATSTLGISSGGGTWGSITGTLADQTDLQAALDAKLSTTTAASTYVAQALTLNTLALTGDQTFATGTAGTDFGISSSGSVHTFNIPDAGASSRGLVTTGTQTFAGAKTFSSDLTLSGTSANILLGSNWLSGDGGDEGVYVNSSGNVGINTSSPAQKLHVSGSGSTYMMIENTGTSGFAGVFGKNDTGKTAEFGVVASGQATYRILRANEAYLYTASEAFNFTIDNAAGTFRWGIGPTTVAKMVLDSSGNLGIGTTTPSTLLHASNAANGGTVATIQNTFADLTVDTSLLDLKFTDPTDTEAYFLRGVDAANTVRWSFTRDGLIMGTAQSIQTAALSGGSSNLLLSGRGSNNTDIDSVTIQPAATMTNTSGTRATLEILPSYNQTSGTAANNDLLINRTETSVGSGAQYLINAGVGGGSFVSKFNVSNTGAGYFAGNISAANFSGSSSGTNTGDQDLSGYVTSVSGTSDRITSTGGVTPVLDISASYVGQSSITTLGTIGTGVWNGTDIDVAYGGTGLTSLTEYALLAGGTSTTGAMQQISGLGTSGQVLTSNGAGALPTWQAAAGGGITSLNTLTGGAQTFAVGTSGSDFAISSSGTEHTFNIPDAGASARGLVTTGTQTFAGAKTFSGNLALSGSSANILLGSNYLSGDGADEGIYVDSNGRVGINNSAPYAPLVVTGTSAATAKLGFAYSSGFGQTYFTADFSSGSQNSNVLSGYINQIAGTGSQWLNVLGNLSVQFYGNVTTSGVLYTGNGSAAAPAYSFSGQTGTGMWRQTNWLMFSTNGVNGLGMTSAGRVHIGTMGIDSAALGIANAGGATDYIIRLRAHASQSGNILHFETSGASSRAALTSGYLWQVQNGSVSTPAYSSLNDTNTGMYFGGTDTLHFATAGTARLNIDASGHVGIGSTPLVRFQTSDSSTGAISYIVNTDTSNTADVLNLGVGVTNPGGGNLFISYWDASSASATGNQIGYVAGDGAGGVSYTNTSDVRLKNNIQDTSLGLETLLQIKVRDYNFIKSPGRVTQGFIAQELHKIYPYAVATGNNDGTSPLIDGDVAWGVDYGRITPLLVKAIQDQQLILGDFTEGVDYESIFAIEETPIANILLHIEERIASKLNVLSDFVAVRITAMRAYVGDLFADKVTTNKLCIPDSNGVEVCLTGDKLRELLGEEAIEEIDDDEVDNGSDSEDNDEDNIDDSGDVDETLDSGSDEKVVDNTDTSDDTVTPDVDTDTGDTSGGGGATTDTEGVTPDVDGEISDTSPEDVTNDDSANDSGSDSDTPTDNGDGDVADDSDNSDSSDSGSSGSGSDAGSDTGDNSSGGDSGGDSGAAATE